MNTLYDFTHKFIRIFQSTLGLVHSRSKRSFEGLPQMMRNMGIGSRRVTMSSSFFQGKVKAQGVLKRGSCTHKVGHKRGIMSNWFTLFKVP
ncbi:hypothetical protein H5410_031339 [Solanum commersonii]|uniref:Uncharacterized protein n=1 Tax=Solanum commersonii TaxID=4109 RepID=A0A9J5YI48_SOLCO|nr:hypothetical protein H5410_031339 [Solanum commersonii]